MNSDPRSILDEVLHHIGQEHLLAYTQKERDVISLKKEIQLLDCQFFFRLQKQIQEGLKEKIAYIAPPVTELVDAPINNLRQFGCLILAGGQASRLRLDLPKGCVVVTPFSKKSLFQLHAEKIKAASIQMGYPIPLAIMTSATNRAETELFFQEHGYFGLSTNQVSFFSQKNWPLLNLDGNLLLKAPGKLATGPNGNGDIYYQFVKSGIWDRWNKQDIKHVRIIPIDNPLALPIDQTLFATHLAHKNDITIQGIARERGEKAGTLSLINGKLGVLEYGEFEGDGDYSNIGLYLFSMSFIKRVSDVELPIHKVKKSVKTLEGEIPKDPNVWKFETFIFDAFSFSEKSELLIYPRESCFAPLKNFEGAGSMASVQAALLANERKIWSNSVGSPLPEGAKFELGSSFYYPTSEQLMRWKEKEFPGKNVIEDL